MENEDEDDEESAEPIIHSEGEVPEEVLDRLLDTLATTLPKDLSKALESTSSFKEFNDDNSANEDPVIPVEEEQPKEEPKPEEETNVFENENKPSIAEIELPKTIDLPSLATPVEEAKEEAVEEEIKPIIDETKEEIFLGGEETQTEAEDTPSIEEAPKPIIEEEKEEIIFGDSETNDDEVQVNPIISSEDDIDLPVKEETPVKENPVEENVEEEDESVSGIPIIDASKDYKQFENHGDPTEYNDDKKSTYISEPTPTKFCTNCGVVVSEEASICPSCGEPVD